MLNKVILIGNLTREVELRNTPSGFAIAVISLALNRKYKKSDGSMADEVCYVDVKLLGRTAEVAQQYTKKGSKVCVDGHLVLEQWVDSTGNKRSKLLVQAESFQMLDNRSGTTNYDNANEAPAYSAPSTPNANFNKSESQAKVPEINIDDEIPF